jgi:hypothetical protein
MIIKWPWVLTLVAAVAATAVFILSPDMATRSQLGDYVSGFASVIAFIWLVAAYLQQGRELKLQRNEITLQRQSLELQREELKKMGKYAALAQIAHFLEQFEQSLRNNPNVPASSVSELPMAFTNGMSLWKTILESKEPDKVFDAYSQWMKIYVPCIEYVGRFSSAMNLYYEAIGQPAIHNEEKPEKRIYLSYEQIKNIPHISNYVGSAYSISTDLLILEPGINRIRLAGMEATEKLIPGVVKPEALQELQAKVKGHDDALKSKERARDL